MPAEPVSIGEAGAGAGGAITAGDNAIFYVGNLRCEPCGFGEGPALKAQCRVELLDVAGGASTAIACGGKHRPMEFMLVEVSISPLSRLSYDKRALAWTKASSSLSRAMTPAMAAGVSKTLWSMDDVVKMVEEWETAQR